MAQQQTTTSSDYGDLVSQYGGQIPASQGATASTPAAGPSDDDIQKAVQQYGGSVGTNGTAPQRPTATIGPRQGDAATNWLEDLEGDLKHGTGNTWLGRVMQKMGAQGTESGVSPGVAATVGGPATGPARALRGVHELGLDNPLAAPEDNQQAMHGFNDLVGGVGQTVALPLAATQPEFLAVAAPFSVGSSLTQKALTKMGAKPETAEFLTNLAGIGFGAYTSMRSAKVPDYETWRDNNFSPAEGKEGIFESNSGAQYSDQQLQQIHGVLSRQAGNPLISSLFRGPKSPAADYMTWRGQNFRPASQGGWEDPSGRLYTDEGLHQLYDQKSSALTTPTDASIQAVQDALSTARNAKTVARNNPVTNTVMGPDPEALTPVQAFTEATKPRSSIQNFSDHVDRALPDARRALDSLGIDPDNMTLSDAERAVVQAKKDVWDEFEQNHLNPNQHVTLDTSPVADRIQAVADRMTNIQKRRMPGITDEIDQAVSDYQGQQMTVGQIEDRIQELNNQLRSQQAQTKVNETALRRDPKYAHQFAELDGLRQMEKDAFGELSGPEAADLKQRYGSLKVLEDVIDRRINVVERQNPAGLYDTASRMEGLADMAKGLLGRDPKQIGAGMVKMRVGQNAAKLNDPNFLISHAFKKTTPRPPTIWNGEYEPEPPKGLLGPGPIITPPPADTSGSVPFTSPAYNGTTRAQRLGLMLPEQTAIPLGASTAAGGSPEGVLPAQRIIQQDPRTGQIRTTFGPSTGPNVYQDAVQELLRRSGLEYDPATNMMRRVVK